MANQNSSGGSFADLVSMFVNNVGELPGEKGVPSSDNKLALKNIIPSLGSTFNRSKRINPLLTSVEVARTYNTGLVLAKAFYDFNIKRKPDKKSSTIVSQANATVDKSNQSTQLKQQATTSGGLGIIASIIAGIVAIAAFISKYLGPVSSFIGKFLVKLPSVLKGLEGLKVIVSQKLFALLDNFKATKLGEKFTKIISRFKPGIIGDMFRSIGTKIGSRLGFIFKRLPIVGALMNFTFAYMRWKEGKYITSILEILSGIASLTVLGGFLPGAVISLAIDGVILLTDLLSSGDMAAKTSGFVHGAKLAGKSLVKILKNTASVLGKKLLAGLKFIPFIGGVAGLALAYMRFKDGDWIAGTVELVSAIADFIPGVGNVVSLILDGGLLLYDIFRTKKSEGKAPVAKSTNSFTDLKEKYGKKIMDILWYVPGISGLLYVGRAASKFFKGDFKGGIKDLGLSIIGFVGGKGAVDFLSWTLGLFNNKTQKSEDITAKQVSFADIISSSITSMIETFQTIFTNIIDYAKSFIERGKEFLFNSVDETLSSFNEYNPFVIAHRNVIGLNSALEEDERLAKLASEKYRELRKKRGLDSTKDLQSSISIQKDVSLTNLPTAKKELDTQTKLIELQNELLLQLVHTSKEQLNVSKNKKPTVAVVDGGSKSTNINTNNAFSTSKSDGRSMYNKSPYSISPSYA